MLRQKFINPFTIQCTYYISATFVQNPLNLKPTYCLKVRFSQNENIHESSIFQNTNRNFEGFLPYVLLGRILG